MHPVLWCVLQNLGNLKVIKPWWVAVKKWTGDQLWNILLHTESYFYFSLLKKYTLKNYFSCQIKHKWQVQVQTHLVVLSNNIIENKVCKWVFKYHFKKFFRDMLFPNNGFYGYKQVFFNASGIRRTGKSSTKGEQLWTEIAQSTHLCI